MFVRKKDPTENFLQLTTRYVKEYQALEQWRSKVGAWGLRSPDGTFWRAAICWLKLNF